MDVFAKLMIGDGSEWNAQTEIEQGAGSEVVWMTKLSGPVASTNQVLVEKIHLSVWLRNPSGKDLLLGQAVVAEPHLIFKNKSKWTQLLGDIHDKNGDFVGVYTLTARYLSMASKVMSAGSRYSQDTGSVDVEELTEPVECAHGFLDVYDIHVTSRLGRSSPFEYAITVVDVIHDFSGSHYSVVEYPADIVAQVMVGSGDVWNHCTEVSWGHLNGDTVSWYPQVTQSVPRAALSTEGIMLRVRAGREQGQEVVIAKAELGDGAALLEYENQWVMLSGSITDAHGVVLGTYCSYMKYRPAGSEPNFSYGTPRDSVSGTSWDMGHSWTADTPENMRGFLDIYDIHITSPLVHGK